MLNIFTYNLLADPLANTTSYRTYHPKVLDSKRRWGMTMKILGNAVEKGADILCLQEVGKTRRSQLEDFFDEKGYRTFFMTQGDHYNDYMGLMLVARRTLSPRQPEYIKISDVMENEYKVDEFHLQEILDKLRSERRNDALLQLHNVETRSIESVQVKEEPTDLQRDIDTAKAQAVEWYEKVKRNWNWIIRIKVQYQGVEVVIATTHLPCRYADPRSMILYARAVISTVKDHPFSILAGDFNISSKELAYNSLVLDMKSAHVLACCTEPEFTTSAETTFRAGPPNAFKGTIDYVLVKGFTKSSILHVHEETEKLPSETHPSDHLPLFFALDLFSVPMTAPMTMTAIRPSRNQ